MFRVIDDFNDSRDFPRADHQRLKNPSEAFRRPCKNACHNCKDWAVEVGMLLYWSEPCQATTETERSKHPETLMIMMILDLDVLQKGQGMRTQN